MATQPCTPHGNMPEPSTSTRRTVVVVSLLVLAVFVLPLLLMFAFVALLGHAIFYTEIVKKASSPDGVYLAEIYHQHSIETGDDYALVVWRAGQPFPHGNSVVATRPLYEASLTGFRWTGPRALLVYYRGKQQASWPNSYQGIAIQYMPR